VNINTLEFFQAAKISLNWSVTEVMKAGRRRMLPCLSAVTGFWKDDDGTPGSIEEPT